MIDGGGGRGQNLGALAVRDLRMEAFGKLLGDEAGRQLAGLPARMRHQGRQKRNVVADAVDDESIERIALRLDRFRARRSVRDQLGDHRIVEQGNLAAFIDAGVVTHGDAVENALGRRAIARQPAGRRQEVAIRVLGIDAALDGPALELDVVLFDRELLAGRDADHLFDEVDAGDQFGHRMLDL